MFSELQNIAGSMFSFLVAISLTKDIGRCIPLIREDPKRDEFIDCLVQAAESSAARGAHEVCIQL